MPQPHRALMTPCFGARSHGVTDGAPRHPARLPWLPMTDLLHWYARAHGPRAYRVVRAALDGELDASAESETDDPEPVVE